MRHRPERCPALLTGMLTGGAHGLQLKLLS